MKQINIKNSYIKDGLYEIIDIESLLKKDKTLKILFEILENKRKEYEPQLSYEDIYENFNNVHYRVCNALIMFLGYLSELVNDSVYPICIDNENKWIKNYKKEN